MFIWYIRVENSYVHLYEKCAALLSETSIKSLSFYGIKIMFALIRM